MRLLPKLILFAIILSTALASCKSRPKYVIPPDDMAELMADMHTAEAVVEMNHARYNTDSAKAAVKESVLRRRGVTQQQFDTSLVWYAHNIDKYIEMYDKTIEILEKRSAEAGAMAVKAAMAVAGDSVDVWAASRYVVLGDRMPSNMVMFEIDADDNMETGDVYTWRVKLIESPKMPRVKWGIAANYADGRMDYLSTITNRPNWNEVTFVTDSTRQITKLRGYFEPDVLEGATQWVDSISLVRRRVSKSKYPLRSQLKSYMELE